MPLARRARRSGDFNYKISAVAAAAAAATAAAAAAAAVVRQTLYLLVTCPVNRATSGFR